MTYVVKTLRIIFHWLDSIIFSAIPEVYDLLMKIARTSILTQGDIASMADRIYKLLAVFMIFKVTFSLIMYVVNPDDFMDKSKGVGKLVTNIIISLALLILTPYIFRYAYELQTAILEKNTIATVVFGEKTEDNFLNTAGEDMAFITLSPFFTPNLGLTDIVSDCSNLMVKDSSGSVRINESCTGISSTDYQDLNDDSSMFYVMGKTDTAKNELSAYVAGVNSRSLALMFRQDMVVAKTTQTMSNTQNDEWVMDYRAGISTIVGAFIVIILVTFCMDIALRSIKLAFLQLIAPIPIISYVDPKSGKDGLFKKWYQMCFKTFLSLFVRLLAIYFAVYIISKVADGKLVDLIDGHYVTNLFISVFIIIGALMFAKQLPKILEGLGIKLDGDGKFFLNPFKKIEEQALGGKNITGATRGLLTGTVGAFTGAGVGAGIYGAWRGFKDGKGWKETGKQTAEMNRRMRQARDNGSTFLGRAGSRLAGTIGLPTASENTERSMHEIDERIKNRENEIKNLEHQRDQEKDRAGIGERKRTSELVSKSLGNVKNVATEKMKDGVGTTGANYNNLQRTYSALEKFVGSQLDANYSYTDLSGTTHTLRAGYKLTGQDLMNIQSAIKEYDQDGWMKLVDEQRAAMRTGGSLNGTLNTAIEVADKDYETINGAGTAAANLSTGSGLNAELGKAKGNQQTAEADARAIDEKYYNDIETRKEANEKDQEEKRNLYEQQQRQKANDDAVK